MSSPTSRSLKQLRSGGWLAEVVERWNSFARVRKDLFGCIDVLAIRPGVILGVQATSGSNHSARIRKALSLPALTAWIAAGGRFEVWSWAKRKGRWQVRISSLT